MEINRDNLRIWLDNMPEAREFFDNFFGSYDDADPISGFVNYMQDIFDYSFTRPYIFRNRDRLVKAYEDIVGLKVYFDN